MPASAASRPRSPRSVTVGPHSLPAGAKTDASIGYLASTKRGPVNVMIELDAQPGLRGLRGRPQVRAAAPPPRRARPRATSSAPARQRVVAALGRSRHEGHASSTARTRSTRVSPSPPTRRASPRSLALPGVKAVRLLTPKAPSNSTTVPLTGAPASWQSTGQTGEGVYDRRHRHRHRLHPRQLRRPGHRPPPTTRPHATSNQKPTYPDTTKVAGGYDFVGDRYNADPSGRRVLRPGPVPDTNPLDCEGHGSHVSGTAAGLRRERRRRRPTTATTTPTRRFDTMKIGPGMAPERDPLRAEGLRLRGLHRRGRLRARLGGRPQRRRRPLRPPRRRQHVPGQRLRLAAGPRRRGDQQRGHRRHHRGWPRWATTATSIETSGSPGRRRSARSPSRRSDDQVDIY